MFSQDNHSYINLLGLPSPLSPSHLVLDVQDQPQSSFFSKFCFESKFLINLPESNIIFCRNPFFFLSTTYRFSP